MSADEIDAELLALAGDDSDEDAESVVDEVQPIEDKSAVQEPKQSVEKTEESTQNRRGVAQKVRKRGRKKATRRELEDELDDLRDDSPSPAASIGSGEMMHSDSEVDAPGLTDVDEGPLYPLEGKFMSSSDRDHIMSLPEIEREEILAERAQVVLKRQQDMQLRKALAAAQATASKHKRKAAAAELEDGSARKASRPKTEKRSALDDYKKAREAKGTERSSRMHHRSDRRTSRSASSASERDADGESEVEWAEPSSTSRRDRDEPLADLKDFERCRLGRSNFAKICFYPNFESAITGCFCRVSIGMNRETGQNMYRMTQIKGFVEGKPYNLEAANGSYFMTDQYALVAHGSAEKPWPFSACSDTKFSELEFQRYKDTLEKEHLRFPRRSALSQKLDAIHQFLHPQWDEQTLQAKLSRQKAMQVKTAPGYQLKRKLDAIMQRKAEAEESRDFEEVSRCDAELAVLQGIAPDTTNGAEPSPAKTSPAKTKSSQQERLAFLNQKNRDMNAILVRKALIEERRKLQRDRAKALEAAQTKAAAAAAEVEAKQHQAALLAVPAKSEMNDLFGDTPNISRTGTPVSGIGTPKRPRSRQGTPMAGEKAHTLSRSGIGLVVGKKRGGEDEGFDDLDIGIDVEI